MNRLKSLSLLLTACWINAAQAQLQLVPDRQPQQFFGGVPGNLRLVWHNGPDKDFEAGIKARLFQLTSSTAAPLAMTNLHRLKLLSGQTVIETNRMEFPAVRAETRFSIQWSDDADKIIGKTEVLAYPTNLLDGIKLLVEKGEKNLGIIDPKSQIIPALKNSKIPFTELSDDGLDSFAGKLVILCPAESKEPADPVMLGRLKKMAQSGKAVVLLQSPAIKREAITPSFYVVPQGQSAIVFAKPELVNGLAENPQSQLNLVYFCNLAVKPETIPQNFFFPEH